MQTAGRGRHGRQWVSQPGDLVLSVLFKPAADSRAMLMLPLAAGVAVAEAATALGAAVALKWPNDVVVERGRGDGMDYAKLAGILVETVTEGERVAAVVGVGLNLVARNPVDTEPVAGAYPATSLRQETARETARDAAAAAVLERLRVWYDAVARGDAERIVNAFTARALPWWGRMVEVRSGERLVRGVARGIDASGALLIETGGGEVTAVVSGEARQVRPQ